MSEMPNTKVPSVPRVISSITRSIAALFAYIGSHLRRHLEFRTGLPGAVSRLGMLIHDIGAVETYPEA